MSDPISISTLGAHEVFSLSLRGLPQLSDLVPLRAAARGRLGPLAVEATGLRTLAGLEGVTSFHRRGCPAAMAAEP